MKSTAYSSFIAGISQNTNEKKSRSKEKKTKTYTRQQRKN
jgi:hypothetical protein